MKKQNLLFKFSAVMLFLFLWGCLSLSQNPDEAQGKTGQTASDKEAEAYQAYLDFFEKVYDTMEKNYYLDVTRRDYQRFLQTFDTQIYAKLKKTGKSNNYIKWRSAAYLVDALKSEDDIFSGFFPPKPAKEYEQKALGKKIDIGIEGVLTEKGFEVIHVEPRSDSYEGGLRKKDIILQIDDFLVKNLTEEEVKDKLTPLEDTEMTLVFLDVSERSEKSIKVLSQEYFKQTIFMVPTGVPNVFCLELQKFNRKTSEDMFNFLKFIQTQTKDSSLILDLRGNPGGPPLAAREISAFFLTPEEDFAYFQKRDKPKALLKVPTIPEGYRYTGPIVILVNKESGSASELFSGVMQSRGRAVVMGTNTAGKVFLKSMFPFEDESMVVLVTARGHYPDGQVFSFDGVKPDEYIGEEDDLVNMAARYLVWRKRSKE